MKTVDQMLMTGALALGLLGCNGSVNDQTGQGSDAITGWHIPGQVLHHGETKLNFASEVTIGKNVNFEQGVAKAHTWYFRVPEGQTWNITIATKASDGGPEFINTHAEVLEGHVTEFGSAVTKISDHDYSPINDWSYLNGDLSGGNYTLLVRTFDHNYTDLMGIHWKVQGKFLLSVMAEGDSGLHTCEDLSNWAWDNCVPDDQVPPEWSQCFSQVPEYGDQTLFAKLCCDTQYFTWCEDPSFIEQPSCQNLDWVVQFKKICLSSDKVRTPNWSECFNGAPWGAVFDNGMTVELFSKSCCIDDFEPSHRPSWCKDLTFHAPEMQCLTPTWKYFGHQSEISFSFSGTFCELNSEVEVGKEYNLGEENAEELPGFIKDLKQYFDTSINAFRPVSLTLCQKQVDMNQAIQILQANYVNGDSSMDPAIISYLLNMADDAPLGSKVDIFDYTDAYYSNHSVGYGFYKLILIYNTPQNQLIFFKKLVYQE